MGSASMLEGVRSAAHPFVGREAQVGMLLTAAAGASAGAGSLVLVAGEPGIGKTRLVEELARRAAAGGTHVVWATCWEGGGAPAFWPWTQLPPAPARHPDPAP